MSQELLDPAEKPAVSNDAQYLELINIAVANWHLRQSIHQRLHANRHPQNSLKRFEFPSDANELNILEVLVEHLQTSLGIHEVPIAFKTMVLELVVNAMKHGNRRQADKNILVVLHIEREHVEFYVADQGEGFDPKRIEDRRQQSLLYDTHGRGTIMNDRVFLPKLKGTAHYLPIDEGSDKCREIVVQVPLSSIHGSLDGSAASNRLDDTVVIDRLGDTVT